MSIATIRVPQSVANKLEAAKALGGKVGVEISPAEVAEMAALPRVTREEVMAARTPRGGWTKATLAAWGVEWPPRPGWLKELTGEA